MTSGDYLYVLLALKPRGWLWDTVPDGVLVQVLGALADALARVDQRGDALLTEMDPRTTYELLPEWERALGLPDPCAGEALSVADRQAAVVARLTGVGGQSIAYLKQQIAALGHPGAVIEEFQAATCESACEVQLFSEPWRHVFMVRLPFEPEGLGATCVGSCADYLGAPPVARVECRINRIKPAHTRALFAYGMSEEIPQ